MKTQKRETLVKKSEEREAKSTEDKSFWGGGIIDDVCYKGESVVYEIA